MCDPIFYDPLADRESPNAKDGAFSEALPPQKGNATRTWRRGPDKRRIARRLVRQDLQLLASQVGSSDARKFGLGLD
ncbi:hypothetical protein ACFVVC_01590 [Pseudarthrobacter sp. NPDC058196]|uniref:hypothetical protein n=1 Tax=Pseudarthrobacter sp. NPDC058196 TaxID=3346376 RepID=UPI0036D9FD7A